MSQEYAQSKVNNLRQRIDLIIEDVISLSPGSKNAAGPQSPTRKTKYQSSGLLSPKGDISSKLLGQQSPQIQKNKYNILKKLYEKALQQKPQISEFNQKYNQKKQELQGYKIILSTKLSNNQEIINQEIKKKDLLQQKKSQIQKLQNQFKNLQHNNQQLNQNHKKLEYLRIELKRIEEISYKKYDIDKKNIILKKIHELQQQLNNKINSLQGNKNTEQAESQLDKRKFQDKKRQLGTIIQKLNCLNLKYPSQKNPGFTLNDANKQALIIAIERKKNQINAAKARIKQKAHTQIQNQKINPNNNQTNKIKTQVDQLKKAKLDLQKSFQQNKSQIKETQKIIKNNIKNIQRQRQKIIEKSNKNKKLETQKQNIETQIGSKSQSKLIYIQKMPEQIIELQKTKEQIQKKVKTLIDLQIKQKQTNNSVPPRIVQDLNKRIQGLLNDHKKYTLLISNSLKLIEENKKLIYQRDGLEWEKNPELKLIQDNKKKQQNNHQQITQEVNNIRKNVNVVNLKLEQYQVSYPDFKLEKKIKKVEPAPQPVAQQKKQEINKKSNKNNKNSQPTQTKNNTSGSQQKIIIGQNPILLKTKQQIKQIKEAPLKLIQQIKAESKSGNENNKKNKKKR